MDNKCSLKISQENNDFDVNPNPIFSYISILIQCD